MVKPPDLHSGNRGFKSHYPYQLEDTMICPRCQKNPMEEGAPYCDDCNWEIQKREERNDSGV